MIEGFKETLESKRSESLVLVDGVKRVIEATKVEGYFEWPKNNDGWKQKQVEELMKSFPFSSEIDGCAYNLKSSEGRPMKKNWKTQSTHKKVKDYLKKTCKGHTNHAQVRRKDGKASEEYTEELVEEIVDCVLEVKKNPMITSLKRAMTNAELEAHQKAGHHPYDSRCKGCLLGGIKDRPHYRRPPRDENTLAVDVAGRFKEGQGPEGKGYKYMLIATFNASKKK
jgi:hypothetical protein